MIQLAKAVKSGAFHTGSKGVIDEVGQTLGEERRMAHDGMKGPLNVDVGLGGLPVGVLPD
jgi:hypothetical protein